MQQAASSQITTSGNIIQLVLIQGRVIVPDEIHESYPVENTYRKGLESFRIDHLDKPCKLILPALQESV